MNRYNGSLLISNDRGGRKISSSIQRTPGPIGLERLDWFLTGPEESSEKTN